MVPRKIKIETVLNGWKVRVGCKEVVFMDREQMFAALSRYLDEPKDVEKEYEETSVNAKHFKEEIVPFLSFANMLRGGSPLDSVKKETENSAEEVPAQTQA